MPRGFHGHTMVQVLFSTPVNSARTTTNRTIRTWVRGIILLVLCSIGGVAAAQERLLTADSIGRAEYSLYNIGEKMRNNAFRVRQIGSRIV